LASVWLLSDNITTDEELSASLEVACEIRDICALVGKPKLASSFITAMTPIATVRASLINKIAAEDESTHTSSIPPSSNSKPTIEKPLAIKTADIWASRRI
jgi:hypothetical protein